MSYVASRNYVPLRSIAANNYIESSKISSINTVNFFLATQGFLIGGQTILTYDHTVTKTLYSTGVSSAVSSASLSIGKQNASGVSDAKAYGWITGGITGSEVATSERITYSTSTIASNTATNLGTARGWATGLSDLTTYGYNLGGRRQSVNTLYNLADRITFSTNTSSALASANLSQAKRYHASANDGIGTYGYTSGGSNNFYLVTNDRLVYSTSTTSASTTYDLTVTRGTHSGLSSGSTYGYWCGGITSTGAVNTIQRMTFSSGVCTAHTSTLLAAKYYAMTISDGATYGYIQGGFTGATIATVDRMTFSTGAINGSTTYNLDKIRNQAAVCNENGI